MTVATTRLEEACTCVVAVLLTHTGCTAHMPSMLLYTGSVQTMQYALLLVTVISFNSINAGKRPLEVSDMW